MKRLTLRLIEARSKNLIGVIARVFRILSRQIFRCLARLVADAIIESTVGHRRTNLPLAPHPGDGQVLVAGSDARCA